MTSLEVQRALGWSPGFSRASASPPKGGTPTGDADGNRTRDGEIESLAAKPSSHRASHIFVGRNESSLLRPQSQLNAGTAKPCYDLCQGVVKELNLSSPTSLVF